MKISVGADHGGFQLKELLRGKMEKEGHEIVDRGAYDPAAVDYPDIAFLVANDVKDSLVDRGILICGTGIGMSNAASRVEGVVAALCTNEYMARMARFHNNAYVLCLGSRVIGDEVAWAIIKEFIANDPLTDEKYNRRRKKVEKGA